MEFKPANLLFGVLAPSVIWILFLNKFFQINGLVELVCLGTRITDKSLRVKRLGDLHDGLTVQAKESTTHHLEIHRGQRQRSPFAFRFLGDFCNLCLLCHEATFEHHDDSCTIKEMNPFPEEIDLFAFSLEHDLDGPECLWFEIPNSEVSIDHKAQGGELA